MRETLQPIWPGFDSQTQRHMWVEFVGSLICSESFVPRVLRFSPLLKKPTFVFIWFQITVSPISASALEALI